jgi:hypothetical protein
LADSGEPELRDVNESLSLVFSHRPSWRQSLFAGISTARRRSMPDEDGQRTEHNELRVFLKWSRTFERLQ